MSKDNNKKFEEIEDPLACLGFDAADEEEEAAEAAEDAAECASEMSDDESAEESVSFMDKAAQWFADVKEKASEVLAPAIETAEKKMDKKPALIIIGSVAAAAIIAAVLIFALYSGASYSSGRSVEEFAEEWNAVSFSDSCTYKVYDYYAMQANMETLMVSDTDHVYLTDEDVKALKKGKTVTIFDDMAELSVETYKGDFKLAHLSMDYDAICEYYFGKDYASDSFRYSPGLIDDSTFRVLAACAMMVSPFNDAVNTQDELMTQILYLYVNHGAAYNYGGGNRIDAGDYSYSMYYSYEDNLVVSGSDIMSGSDAVSATDISASDISSHVETHLIVHITCEYNKAGQKKHAADWSWWTELFPAKDESQSAVPDSMTEPEYEGDLSAGDASEFSATDISATDAE